VGFMLKSKMISAAFFTASAASYGTLPTLTLNGNLLPCISHNVHVALGRGLPDILQRDVTSEREKFAQSCGSVAIPIDRFSKADNVIYACSGYPMAASTAGGAGAQIMVVPQAEAQTYAGLERSFFQQYRINHGDQFRVALLYPGIRIKTLMTTKLVSPSAPGQVTKCR